MQHVTDSSTELGTQAAGDDARSSALNKTTQTTQKKVDVRNAILRYLSKHPHAADTSTGICRWWLPQEGIDETEHLVEDILVAMVEQGTIGRACLGDRAVIYGLREDTDGSGTDDASTGRERD